MTGTIGISFEQADLRGILGRPLRTKGCILLFCTSGYAVVECNFTRRALRGGWMAVIFTDTLFSVEKISAGFSVRKFELSMALTDEVTFLSSGPFFDWLSEHPVNAVPPERQRDLTLWLEGMDWIENQADTACKSVMMRNQWQNFFLGFESAVKPLLAVTDRKAVGAPRRLFQRFCQLLCENCRARHDVRFYADKLCVTPYYLSRITHLIFQVSPKELIDRQLIMEIKTMLVSTDFTVKEIADRFSFESASYLGRYFRRHVGMTPLEYRSLNSG